MRKLLLVFFVFGVYSSAYSQDNDIPTDSLSSPHAWYDHGMNKFVRKEYEAAVPYLNKAIELDRGYLEAYYVRAAIELELFRYRSCIYYMDKALTVDPKSAKCYLLRAAARLAMIRNAFSYVQFSEEEKDVQNDSACIDLHKAKELGDWEATKMIWRSCPDAEAHFQLGLEMIDDVVEKHPIDEFDKAIKADDHFAKAYAYRAYCEMNHGMQESADEDLKVAIALDSTYGKAYYIRAMQYANHKGNYKAALADMNKAIRLDSTDIKMYLYRAYLRDRMKDYHGAISDYDKVIAIDSSEYQVYMLRGEVRVSLGDLKGAIADFDESLRVFPEDHSALIDRGKAKAMIKDYTGAIADYTEKLRDGDDYEAYLNRAKAYIAAGKTTEACIDLKKLDELHYYSDEGLWAKYCK